MLGEVMAGNLHGTQHRFPSLRMHRAAGAALPIGGRILKSDRHMTRGSRRAATAITLSILLNLLGLTLLRVLTLREPSESTMDLGPLLFFTKRTPSPKLAAREPKRIVASTVVPAVPAHVPRRVEQLKPIVRGRILATPAPSRRARASPVSAPSADARWTPAPAEARVALQKLNDAAKTASLGTPAPSPTPSPVPYSVVVGAFDGEAYARQRVSGFNWPLPSGGAFRHGYTVRTARSAASIVSVRKIAGKWFCVGYAAKYDQPSNSWAAGPWVGLCDRAWIAQLQAQIDARAAESESEHNLQSSTPSPTASGNGDSR